MPFQKGNKINLGRQRLDMIGHIPWNKGTKYSLPHVRGRIPWNKGLKYTSSKTNPNKTCAECGKPYYAANWEIKENRKYCSWDCYGKEWSRRMVEHAHKRKGISSRNNGTFTPERVTGKANINWKGGVTPINQKIRSSLEYEEWRKSILERDNYTCQFCGEIGGHLQVDHIKPFALFPELRLELSNGRTLCLDCHRKTPTYLNPYMKREDFNGLS